MTSTEQQLLDTLLELEDAGARVNANPKPDRAPFNGTGLRRPTARRGSSGTREPGR